MPSVGSAVDSGTSPPRRRGEATAERILDAAEGLFAERGFAGTTLRDVAARVGIRNPSLYNHFESKEALYEAVLARGIGPLMEALTAFLEDPSPRGRNPAEVVERVMKLLARRPQLPRLVLHETLNGGQHLTPVLRRWIEPAFARSLRLVEVSPGADRWAPDQIPLLMLAMYHVVLGYFAIAPLYQELNGEDLLSSAALERQTRLVREVAEALLSNAPES
jgi:TetR/AcrR family transcriptional regulator